MQTQTEFNYRADDNEPRGVEVLCNESLRRAPNFEELRASSSQRSNLMSTLVLSTPPLKLSARLQKIHENAQKAAREFKDAEVSLLEVIAEVDENKIYQILKFSSLSSYCTASVKENGLGLSEAITHVMIAVARAGRRVPELKKEVEVGNLSIFKAKKICGILNESAREKIEPGLDAQSKKEAKEKQKNFTQAWIEKAKSLSTARLEREVARFQNGGEAIELLKLKLPTSVFEKLERARGIESEALGKEASFEETIAASLELFLERKDKLRKAKRSVERLRKQEEKAIGAGLDSKPVTKTDSGSDETNGILETMDNASPLSRAASGPGGGLSTGVLEAKKKTSLILRPVKEVAAAEEPIPSKTRHLLYLKYQGQCAERDPLTEKRCENKHWLHAHHLKPRSEGGTNDLENLTLLCSGHHRAVHRSEL